MNANIYRTIPESFGRLLGKAWRAGSRLERRFAAWVVGRGVPKALASVLLCVLKLACLAVLLYSAFWLALVLGVVLFMGRSAATDVVHNEDSADFLGQDAEFHDHRDGLFYHPASYNDDPDPRFEDH